MMQQHVALAKRFEQILLALGNAPLARHKGLKLQLRTIDLAVQVREPRKIDRAAGAKNLPFLQFENIAQAVDDFAVGSGFDFQPHGVALVPVVQLRPHRFQNAPRFLFLQIKIAVAVMRNAPSEMIS